MRLCAKMLSFSIGIVAGKSGSHLLFNIQQYYEVVHRKIDRRH